MKEHIASYATGTSEDEVLHRFEEVFTRGKGLCREKAATALGNIRDERAIRPLTNILDDNNSFVRKSAAEALEKITGKRYEYKK